MQLFQEDESSISFVDFAFSNQNIEVNELLSLCIKASHKKGQQKDSAWLDNFKLQLTRLNSWLESGGVIYNSVRTSWFVLLNKFTQMVTLFEQQYKANCPCAGFLSSPFLNRLIGLNKEATVVINYLKE